MMTSVTRLADARQLDQSGPTLAAGLLYFLLAGLGSDGRGPIVSVPSGNFGNLTAGLIAKRLGLPVAQFVAATNVNDAVPEYLDPGITSPSFDRDRRQRHGRRCAEQFRAGPSALRRRSGGPATRHRRLRLRRLTGARRDWPRVYERTVTARSAQRYRLAGAPRRLADRLGCSAASSWPRHTRPSSGRSLNQP